VARSLAGSQGCSECTTKGGNIWFTFTREAEEQYSQERALKKTLEALAVTKVRWWLPLALTREGPNDASNGAYCSLACSCETLGNVN